MFQLNGKPLALDVPFTDEDGTQYPANWLRLASPEERSAIGVTEVAEQEGYDDRFFWSPSNPKDLGGLKTQWSAQIKDTTNKLLSATDWMVIRKAERDVAIPEATVTYRAAVLAECDRLLAAIQSSETMQQFIDVVSAQQWPQENGVQL